MSYPLTPTRGSRQGRAHLWLPDLATVDHPTEAVRALAVVYLEAVGNGMDTALAALEAVKLAHALPVKRALRNGVVPAGL